MAKAPEKKKTKAGAQRRPQSQLRTPGLRISVTSVSPRPINDLDRFGRLPLDLVALYQFGLSAASLTFDPQGAPRALAGVLQTVPGNPFRLREEMHYLGFSNVRFEDLEAASAALFRVDGAPLAAYGMLIQPTPIVAQDDSLVKMPKGTIGFSFYATRRIEVSSGFLVAYLSFEQPKEGTFRAVK